MKKNYIAPEITVSVLSVENLMIGSDVIIDGGDLFGEE